MLKNVSGIIYGNLQGLNVDTVDIREETEMRQGPIAVFHVRTMYAGYYCSLGFWKIHTMSGDILGISESKKVEFEHPERWTRRIQRIADEQRALFRNRYPISLLIKHFSAEKILNVEQLFYPINFVRLAINSITEGLNFHKKGLEFSKSAQKYLDERMHDFSIRMGSNSMYEGRQLLSRLTSYCAASRNAKNVSYEDVEHACNFLEAIFSVLITQFDISNKKITFDQDTIENGPLFEIFSRWRLFSRLRKNKKDAGNLILLIIDTARVVFVWEHFIKSDDDAEAIDFLKDLIT